MSGLRTRVGSQCSRSLIARWRRPPLTLNRAARGSGRMTSRRPTMADKARRGSRVADGDDRSGTPRGLGIGTLTFKVSTADRNGALMVCEIAHHAQGGPPRHIHHDQDEWYHVIKGEYVIEIGGERFSLGPGDSTFGPRGVPHGWAYVGDGPGRVTFVAVPASRLEPFFIEITKANAMAPQDPAFWLPFNMTLFGPPLELP